MDVNVSMYTRMYTNLHYTYMFTFYKQGLSSGNWFWSWRLGILKSAGQSYRLNFRQERMLQFEAKIFLKETSTLLLRCSDRLGQNHPQSEEYFFYLVC